MLVITDEVSVIIDRFMAMLKVIIPDNVDNDHDTKEMTINRKVSIILGMILILIILITVMIMMIITVSAHVMTVIIMNQLDIYLLW